MATIPYTRVQTGNTRSMVFVWSAIANGDEGEPIPFSAYADKSAQVTGTFGAGGSVRIEGSNDGTNWAALTDPQGNNLDITTAKIEMVTEATLLVRPRVTAGDGTTAISVALFAKE
jgi:hypothetical protein